MYSVLVVDDELEQRRAVIDRVQWEKAGFTVVGDAENGIEALDLLEQLKPDLILTDIKMPLMTGLELAEQVRALRPVTKFVILSGYDTFEYAREALKYNVVRYLLKPISAAEMTEELGKVKAQMDAEFAQLKAGLSEENTKMRLEKTELLLPLLLGNGEDMPKEAELLQRASALDLLPQAKAYFVVVVTKFKRRDGTSATSPGHIDFVNHILRKYASAESFFVNGRIVTLIIGTEEDLDRKMQLPVTELTQSAEKRLEETCTVGISQTVDKLSLCDLACAQAINARRYTADGAGNIRYIEDQERRSSAEFENIEKAVYQLEQLLKFGNGEEIRQFLEALFQENGADSGDYLLLQIMATVQRSMQVLSGQEDFFELSQGVPLFGNRLSFRFADEYKREVTELCISARDRIAHSQRKESEAICDRALQLIREEYKREDLSLTGAAEKLGVSPNYLSALLKKKRDKNFVSLVTEERMKEASNLLLCTTMKIFEISEKCGYSDQHYFSYCFKKYYGESPNKYREKRLGAGNDKGEGNDQSQSH